MDHCIASPLVSFLARRVNGSFGVSAGILSGRVAVPQWMTSSARHSHIVRAGLCRTKPQVIVGQTYYLITKLFFFFMFHYSSI